MAVAYNYSSTAGEYTLTGGITASATTFSLNSVTGLPATPFKVVIDAGQSAEEIVKVTAVAGTSLTVTRGFDGTTAVIHSALAKVRHMATAEDFRLSRVHEDATVAHGATGAVVGTTNAQALTNKNLTDATNVFPTSLVTLTGTQSLTNKNLTGAGNVFPTSLATLTGAQALTNKDLTGAGNTFPGTLALTANVLPLAGGTLTGTLNGTAAAFSGAVSAASVSTTGNVSASGTVSGTNIPKIKHGTVSLAFSSSTTATASVTFAGTAFVGVPNIVITQVSIPSGSSRVIPHINTKSSTGFSVYLSTPDTNPITTPAIDVDWIAIEG